GRRRQRAKALANLPQTKQNKDRHERRERRPEYRRANQAKAREVNEERTDDQRRIRRTIVFGKIAMPSRGEIMHDVAEAVLRNFLARDQRLRPKPKDQRPDDHSGPK